MTCWLAKITHTLTVTFKKKWTLKARAAAGSPYCRVWSPSDMGTCHVPKHAARSRPASSLPHPCPKRHQLASMPIRGPGLDQCYSGKFYNDSLTLCSDKMKVFIPRASDKQLQGWTRCVWRTLKALGLPWNWRGGYSQVHPAIGNSDHFASLHQGTSRHPRSLCDPGRPNSPDSPAHKCTYQLSVFSSSSNILQL